MKWIRTEVTEFRVDQAYHWTSSTLAFSGLWKVPRTFQRWRQLRGDAGHQGHPDGLREGGVEASGDLSLVVRDGRRVLPLRRADLRHEVWQLDLWRVSGKFPISSFWIIKVLAWTNDWNYSWHPSGFNLVANRYSASILRSKVGFWFQVWAIETTSSRDRPTYKLNGHFHIWDLWSDFPSNGANT